MPNLTPEGLRRVTEIASRHGVGLEAASALLDSLALGNGAQAQFDHPDLGGMGQWSRGGMIMIGDMFNHGLKHRVDALCNDLAGLLRDPSRFTADAARPKSESRTGDGTSLFVAGPGSGGRWWPAELGEPGSVGAQNELRYAYFPGARRIAIRQGGRVRVYDSGEHRLSGFSQQQGGDQSLTFTSQFGIVRVADLAEVSGQGGDSWAPSPAPVLERGSATAVPTPQAAPATPVAPASQAASAAAPLAANEILAIIESLAGLRDKNILTEEEFSAKKAELLRRL
jgi:hypothetical protein